MGITSRARGASLARIFGDAQNMYMRPGPLSMQLTQRSASWPNIILAGLVLAVFLFSFAVASAYQAAHGRLTGRLVLGNVIETGIILVELVVVLVIFAIVARLFRGQGSTLTYVYALVVISVTAQILSTVLSFIPILGATLSFLLTLYTLYLIFQATASIHHLPNGTALGAVLVALVVAILIWLPVVASGILLKLSA